MPLVFGCDEDPVFRPVPENDLHQGHGGGGILGLHVHPHTREARENILEPGHGDAGTPEGRVPLQIQEPVAGVQSLDLDKSEVGTSNGYLLDTYPGNSLRLITERGTLSYNAKLRPGRWVHVAATVGTDGTLVLYLDGKQVASKQAETFAFNLEEIDATVAQIRSFHQGLVKAGLAHTYEAAHAKLALAYQAATCARFKRLAEGRLERLPDPSQYAADQSYLSTIQKLCNGLRRTLDTYVDAKDTDRKKVYAIWAATESLAW